jgi:hypothetical protein
MTKQRGKGIKEQRGKGEIPGIFPLSLGPFCCRYTHLTPSVQVYDAVRRNPLLVRTMTFA